jgi:hypothetical protein
MPRTLDRLNCVSCSPFIRVDLIDALRAIRSGIAADGEQE